MRLNRLVNLVMLWKLVSLMMLGELVEFTWLVMLL